VRLEYGVLRFEYGCLPPATVKECYAKFIIKERGGLPFPIEYDDGTSLLRAQIIAGGEAVKCEVKGESLQRLAMMPTIYFVGRLVYEDDNGVRHRMAFARQFNMGTGRFMTVGDEDYEFSD